ncbi:DUF2637 domain-containing protein [Micromonospora taraxaci]|uniref:DUF2637 domain-containing protein n=1 Tax=Micromonospora taraxaci TaxID=1316803 RepID=UPI0033CFDB7C
MTAPTINGTRYPQPVDDLLPAARDLAVDLGEVPARNELMRRFRIGAPKAQELRSRLLDGGMRDTGLDAGSPAEPGPDLRPVFVEPAGASPSSGMGAGPVVTPVVAEPSPQVTPVGHPGLPADRKQLLRVRWAVRAVLALGVAASIAGNVLHARDELISQIISAWSPLALLLTVELISRVPVHRRALAVARWIATALIAGIAAWVSYWHMAAVASRYGETGGAQYLLPLSVDGLVVVASICLVELGGRIATARRNHPTQEV